MDAGARGRRLLQRREYKAKVSDFVPKELEDSYKMTSMEANSAQQKAMHDAKIKRMEDDKVAQKKKKIDEKVEKKKQPISMKVNRLGSRMSQGVPTYDPALIGAVMRKRAEMDKKKKETKEEVQLEAKKSCGEGEYYCNDSEKCKPIPEGMKVGKDGMLVSEDMKGMSQKSGDKRSTDSGAGMTAKGVAKYNRRTGGNLKTAVTTPPSKLKAGSKAAKRRKSFCARSKSWDGPRGKAARRRWNCSYEPELPMIIDEKKKLFNSAPLSDRVAAWSKKITEGDSYVKSDRNKFGLPKDLKSTEKKSDKKITGVNYGAMAQSYVPQGEMIERKMTSAEKDKKEKYVKGMKKDKGGFTKRYGKDGKSVMYATATKMAMKEVLGGIPGDGYLGHPNLNIKNPFAKKQIKEPVLPKAKPGSGGMINRVGAQMGDYNMQIQKLLNQSYEPEGEMTEDFYRKKYTVKDGYKKTDKMTKSNKRSGDSKAQYRELHKDLAKIKEGSLHKWFKGSKSKDGKGGWVNVVTGGTCASDKPGEGTPKCVSSSKRASMSKAERLSASRRKKKADPGQQSKSGAAKPTYVATDSKKKK